MKTKYYKIHLKFIKLIIKKVIKCEFPNDMEIIKQDVVGSAIDQGIISPDDVPYVDSVIEIDKFDFDNFK